MDNPKHNLGLPPEIKVSFRKCEFGKEKCGDSLCIKHYIYDKMW